jgi:WD40 repeat protein
MENQKMTEHAQFTRHRGPITCAAQVPNSSKIITSGYDCAVALFDTESDQVELLGYHDHLVNRVTVNDSGTLAATSSSDYNLYIWDIDGRKIKTVLQGHSDDVEDFVFISDHRGASVSRDYRIIVWNLDSGSIEKIILGHEKDVLSINYFDGRLYTSGDDMTLRIWDIESGQQLKLIGPFETETDTCAIDPANNRIVLGCDDGFIRIFDIRNGDLIKSIPGHERAIKKVAVSPTTGDILSAAYDQQIFIWDCDNFELKQELPHHSALWERSFNWTDDGRNVVAGSFDGTVLIWCVETKQLLNELGRNKDGSGNACFNDLAAKNDNEFVAVSDDGLIRTGVLNQSTSRCDSSISPSEGRILMNAVNYSNYSNQIIAGAHDQSLYLFDGNPNCTQKDKKLALQEGPINCVQVSNVEGYQGDIFAACYSGTIAHVDKSGELNSKLELHPNAVKALALHPTEPIGVSCCAEGTLRSWNYHGDIIREFKAHTAIIDDVDIDPSGRFIVSAGRDFVLKIHELETGNLCENIPLGNRSPKALCFYSENEVIVTNYWGELLRVTLNDGKVLRRTIAQNGISGITRLENQIAVTSYDGSIYRVDPVSLEVINTYSEMQQKVEHARAS